MKKIPQILIPLSIAILLRLYPTISSGQPFSVDAWSPIRNSELLIEHSPISLGEDKIFDGYNNYWPAVSIFGALLANTVDAKPKETMAVAVPLTASLTVIILYALLSRALSSPKPALFASTLLASAFPYSLFTAGVTKETYASPLYLLLILTPILYKCDWRQIIILTISSMGLVLSHHLTALIAAASLGGMTLASLIVGIEGRPGREWTVILPFLILTTVGGIYFASFAYRGLKVTLTINDLLSAASYQTIAFAITLYFATRTKRKHSIRTVLSSSTLALTGLLFMLLCTVKPITPDAPTLPLHYALHAAPYILPSPLIILGFQEARGKENFPLLFWLACILGLEAYAIFGNPPVGLTLIYRTLNFLCAPLAVFTAIGLHALFPEKEGFNRRHHINLAAAGCLLLLTALNSYGVYAAVNLQERFLGYFWLYTGQEYEAAEWISKAVGSQRIAGDVKVLYLLKGYFNKDVDVTQGLLYLTGGSSAKPRILFTYNRMLNNGYVVYQGLSANLPAEWTVKASYMSQVYCNGEVKIFSS
ncbi:MAG: hypothetical protein NZ952_00015 [Candidatus Bathyarchaeota archaeon]|nr:hypothetical protein [Candidatus Bathyarchaeota archaeon]